MIALAETTKKDAAEAQETARKHAKTIPEFPQKRRPMSSSQQTLSPLAPAPPTLASEAKEASKKGEGRGFGERRTFRGGFLK